MKFKILKKMPLSFAHKMIFFLHITYKFKYVKINYTKIYKMDY